MTAWAWYEAFPPRGMTLEASTNVMRALAGRPRFGLLGLVPLAVFELWLYPERVRWLVGMDEQISDRLPGELMAQCPELVLVHTDNPKRPAVVAGREVRFKSLAYPIRGDVAEGVTAALLRIRQGLRPGEAVALQFVIGPGQFFAVLPQRRTPLDVLGFTSPPEPDSNDRRAFKRKVSEPLFAIRGRTGAVAKDPRRAAGLTRPVFSALALANDRHGRVQVSAQSSRVAHQLMAVMGRARTWSSIVNAGELATVIGWNIAEMDVPGSGNGFAPPPPELLDTGDNTSRPVGRSQHPATPNRPVHLPLRSYAAHCHVIAPTNAGKSTMLAHWAVAEAEAGRSLVVIEPKGDLVDDILSLLPEERRDDVVIIDPGADAHLPVISFNPLQGAVSDAERRADSLLGLFKELFGANIGPRSSDVLLHALIALSRSADGTLTDVMPFLSDERFRRSVLAHVSDPLTLAPWAAWFDTLSVGELGQVVAPIGNKLRIISARPSIRRLLGQPDPAFRLESIFECPTIVLVNLNAGAIGAEGSKIIGTLLLHQLWDAIQRQTTKPPKQRRAVPIFVDEFQGYTSGLDFADVLARARGAGAPFTVAHQHLDQLSPTLKSAVLANARSRVVFRPAEGDSAALATVLGKPVTADDLARLPAFHALVRVPLGGTPSPAFEVATLPLPKSTTDPRRLRRQSAERYGTDPKAIDDAILHRWRGDEPDEPVGARRKQP
ncbi:type IV secretory pathway VirD4 components-like protein [Catenulispora acidiphila DSM 44928]|uniref:Type IV secretory pathway VirD4 components-like protein n=1 Tax=Catenulispora acidiphila (strain DSM 44928 / JCM 14897 / NBRC 102108 / NRRL B-24433 / ID139908) TaxID=479433 RepID=C7Q8H1_CATAD|nr:conjugal transfer protein TraG [Catenulispora acidiphila]ACU76159.1 type IV secretory pathway VirD4 components-like protein [Catenulispora acidiphila DSM 44928]